MKSFVLFDIVLKSSAILVFLSALYIIMRKPRAPHVLDASVEDPAHDK
jgi:hypothetical protein